MSIEKNDPDDALRTYMAFEQAALDSSEWHGGLTPAAMDILFFFHDLEEKTKEYLKGKQGNYLILDSAEIKQEDGRKRLVVSIAMREGDFSKLDSESAGDRNVKTFKIVLFTKSAGSLRWCVGDTGSDNEGTDYTNTPDGLEKLLDKVRLEFAKWVMKRGKPEYFRHIMFLNRPAQERKSWPKQFSAKRSDGPMI